MVAAIRNAMEATCGYCPGDQELEEAVRAGLACLAEAGEGTRVAQPPKSKQSPQDCSSGACEARSEE